MTQAPRIAFAALVAVLMATGAVALQDTRAHAAPHAAGARLVGHNPEGPPPAYTGGFGEPTCHECHFDAELNAGTGTLELDGLPAHTRPGATHRVTIRLAHPDMLRAGFMLSTRTRDGAQAGTLRATDARATVTDANGVAYAHHTYAGTAVDTDTSNWVVEWTADGVASGDSVYVHVTANAGNDDASPFGDYIYAKSVELRVK